MPFIMRLTIAMDEPKQGWSENWYFQRDTVVLKDLLDEFDPLARLRAKLLGANAGVTHMRVSVVTDVATGNHIQRVSLGRELNYFADSTNKLCQPHDSLLVQCVTADQRLHKPLYLGGTWMRNFDELRHYNPVDDYATRFNNWAMEVKARGLGWLTQAVAENRQILGYTTDAVTGRTTYNLDGPITMQGDPPRRRVTVNFPGGHEALDGVQIVGPVTGEANKVITVKPRPSHAFDGRIGIMRSYTYALAVLGPTQGNQPAATIDPQRGARRNRGKALYAEAGRRPALIRY